MTHTVTFDDVASDDDEVALDDKLLDQLGSAMPLNGVGLDDLGCKLLLWRREIERRPFRAYRVRLVSAVSKKSAAGAAALCTAVLLVLGLFLVPVTKWWWAVPVLGLSAMAGAYLVVATMRPEAKWELDEIDDEDQPR
jgi:hypothetical protein